MGPENVRKGELVNSGNLPPYQHHRPQLSEKDLKRLDSFALWLDAYMRGNRDADFVKRGVQIAKERRTVMRTLIQAHAEEALLKSIGFSQYSALPPEVRKWVEEPFSLRAEVEVIATCHENGQASQYSTRVETGDGERYLLGDHERWQFRQSKSDAPLQGIRLDGWMAIEPDAFKRLDPADEEWALANLPALQSEPGVDFFSGYPLGDNPVTALIGGYVVRFAGEETLEKTLKLARSLDRLAGSRTGSSAFLEETLRTRSAALPVAEIQDRQQQLLLEETTGPKKTLLIQVDFPDYGENQTYKDYYEELINGEVSQYLSDYSYGLTSVSATMSESIYRMSLESVEYDWSGEDDTVDEDDLFDEAVAAYRADVEDKDPFLDYDVVAVVFVNIGDYDWSGKATIGGSNSRMWLNGLVDTDTVLHEYGHNYGLLHANYWNHTATNNESTNPIDPTGASIEYGDHWDVMGEGDARTGHFHPAAKRYLGWLNADQVLDFTEKALPGVYRVFQFDSKEASRSHIQAIQIRKGLNEFYWIGLRKSQLSHTDYGSYFHWERAEGAARNQCWLISPFPAPHFESSVFGKTFSDIDSGIHITPIALGGSSPEYYLEVGLNFGDISENRVPALTLEVPPVVKARELVQFTADAIDPDGDELAYAWDLGDLRFIPNTRVLETRMAAGGSYDIKVRVSDLKGGMVEKSTSIFVDDPMAVWRKREPGLEMDLFSIEANGSRVVAGGEGGIAYSINGINWHMTTSPGISEMTILDIFWTGTKFVAVGYSYTKSIFAIRQYPLIYSSTNGVTWSWEFELPPLTLNIDNRFHSVSSNVDGSIIIAAGDAGYCYRSTNEGQWDKVSLSLPERAEISGIAFGDGVFILTGRDISSRKPFMLRSSDGLEWEDILENVSRDRPYFPDIEFTDGKFFALTEDGHGVSRCSMDNGETWKILTGRFEDETYSVAFGEGLYCAASRLSGGSADSFAISLSVDGEHWQNVGLGGDNHAADITFFKDTFLAVGYHGQIFQSIKLTPGYEGWIDRYLEGEFAAANANPDGDWASNLWEWAMGTLPLESKSAPRHPQLHLTEAGHVEFVLDPILNPERVTLIVEKSTDLTNWTELPSSGLEERGSYFSILSTAPVPELPCFLRLRLREL